VHERDAEPRTRGAQDVAAIGGAVIEVEGVRGAVLARGAHQESEHVGLHFGVVGFERDDVSGRVVEQPVDAQGPGAAADEERGTVADVAVPQGPRSLGLPAQPRLAGGTITERDSVEAALGVETPHRRLRDHAGGNAAVRGQRAQDGRHRREGVFAADVEQQLALLGGQRLGAAAVAARFGPQRLEPPVAVGGVPAL
jgi:hypothetical protein